MIKLEAQVGRRCHHSRARSLIGVETRHPLNMTDHLHSIIRQQKSRRPELFRPHFLTEKWRLWLPTS